ncbi:MAG: serine hydrolase domain-containing protein, partial [Myxococcaceae bacterium]
VAVSQGVVSMDDSVCKHFSGLRDELCAITVKHLITFGPGLQWQESYERQGYQGSSVISMLLGEGRKDQVKFVLDHKLTEPPGSSFLYSTGTAHVLATLAKKALEPAHGADAFWTLLFEKIGMKRVVLEEDPKGAALAGSYVYATPRDFAKFGYLFLNDGCWENQRVLPENWVSDSTTISDVFLKSAEGESTPAGYMWWLNRTVPDRGVEKPWEGAPEDTYAALGHWGQYVLVIPSEKTVIVRMGDDRSDYLKIGELVRLSLEVAR